MVGSEELACDETLPDLRRLKLANDGSGAGYLDSLHRSLLVDCWFQYKEAFLFGRGVAGALWQ